MKPRSWSLLFVVALSVFAVGQEKDPTFSSKAQLVLVPAVVTRHGEAVRGLKPQDFVMMHDGQAEKVAVFDEIDAVPAKVETVQLPAHTVQNFAPADAHQDVVILLLDFLNGSWSTNALIRSYLSDMVRGFGETHTPVTVLLLTKNGLVQVHSFTSSPENLTKAVEQWSAKIPLDAQHTLTEIPRWSSALAATDTSDTTAALQQFAVRPELLNAANLDRASMATDAVEQIAEAFRGIPGRKKMIWFSNGFILGATRNRSDATTSSDILADFQINDKRTRAWKALSDANIAVYPVDSNGGQDPSWNERFDVARGGDRLNRAAPPPSVVLGSDIPSMMDVARRTGGQPCTDLPPACIKRMQADGNHYYVLGFYLHGEKKPGWHKLKVTLNLPDMSARTREGFVVGDPDNESKSNQQPGGKLSAKQAKKEADRQTVKATFDKETVITALASPLDYTSIPLRLNWSKLPTQSKDTGNQIELVLNSPPGGISLDSDALGMNVDYLAFIRPVGKIEGQSFPASLVAKLNPQQQKSFAVSGFLYRKQVVLAPGRYEVRILLRDNVANKIGTVSTLIDLTTDSPQKP